MKILKNHRGYTLIISLVLIVLILLFTATFTLASINQAKQVNRTDDSFVANSTSEMGIEKFVALINSEIEKNKDSYASCISDSSKNDFNCYKEIYTKIYNNVLLNATEINEPDFFRINVFNITPPNILTETIAKNHLINFESIGIVKNSSKETKIKATVKLPFIILAPNSEETVSENSFSLPIQVGVNTNLIKNNTKIKAKDINAHFSSQKINYFSESADFEQVKANKGQLPKGLSNLKIYAKNVLNFDKFVDTTNQTVLQANKIIFSHSSSVQTDIKNSFLRANIIDFCIEENCNSNNYSKSINVANSCIIVNKLTPFIVKSINFTDSSDTSLVKPLNKTQIYFFDSNNQVIPNNLLSYYKEISNFQQIDNRCIIGKTTTSYSTNNVKIVRIDY